MFKTCTYCNKAWPSRDDFLIDRGSVLIGYQASFDNLRAGLFLFNHSCGTTLSIRTDKFRDLYNGAIYPERKTGGPECPGFCKNEQELGHCPAQCEGAYVREIMQIIKGRVKST